MTDFLKDEGQRKYCCFLVAILVAASAFAAAIWLGNGYRIKEAALCHDRNIIFSLMEQGVSEAVIVEAFTEARGGEDKAEEGRIDTEEGETADNYINMKKGNMEEEMKEKEIMEDAAHMLRRAGISEETEVIFMPGILAVQKGTGIQLAGLFFFLWVSILALTCFFFSVREQVYNQSTRIVEQFIRGDFTEHLPRMEEGCLYRLLGRVDSLANALSAGHEEAVRAKNFLKDTISDISHQLKTPLSALAMYNEIMETEIRSGEKNKEIMLAFAEKTSAALMRMEGLIQVLLKMTRLDAGAVVFEKQEWLLADVVSRAIEELWVRAEEEEKEIVLEGEEQVLVNCDLQWTGEAIGNLVKNALDYTDRGGKIFVSWEKLSGMIRVSVTDNGKGIAEEDLYHIFKRFYRSAAGKGSGQGIGLGLPLAKAIAEGQGGTLSVQSRTGEGTVFTIMLPG